MRRFSILFLLLGALTACDGGGRARATGPVVNFSPVITCEEDSGGRAGVGDTTVSVDVNCPTDSGNTVTNPAPTGPVPVTVVP